MTHTILEMPTNQTSGVVSSNTTWAASATDDPFERMGGGAILRRIAAGGILVPALALAQSQGLAGTANVLPGEVWQIQQLERDVDKSSLSPSAMRLLGEHNDLRFARFLRYPNGWDSGRGKALDSRSLASLNVFVSAVSHFPSSVSLFMTSEGYLQIAWDSPSGPVELDFLPDELVAYIEAEDRELVLPVNGAGVRSMAVRLALT
jgi:hypothetical protein